MRRIVCLLLLFCFLPVPCVGAEEAALSAYDLIDSVTGRHITAVGQPGANTAHQYPTAQSWGTDNETLVLNTNIDGAGSCDLVAYNVRTGETCSIGRSSYYASTVSSQNEVLYTSGDAAYAVRLDTLDRRLLAHNPDGRVFYGVPSVSGDGSVMTAYWKNAPDNLPRSVCTIDTATGSLRQVVTPAYVNAAFAPPQNYIDHPLINPTDTNVLFYCRGSEEKVDMRMWTLDIHAGVHRNAYVQAKQPDGSVGEYVGHEMWSPDGERLYFVKYEGSPMGQSGIMYVDKCGENAELLNGEYPYLHLSVSPDNRWIVADTKYEYVDGARYSNVVCVNVDTGDAVLLARVRVGESHPGHAHPSFSQDGEKVAFTFADAVGKLWVGVMDVSDITGMAQECTYQRPRYFRAAGDAWEETMLPSAGTIQTRTAVTNNAAAAQWAVLLVGTYDRETGALKALSSSEALVPPGGTALLRTQAKVDQGETLKTFVWDGVDTLRPLMQDTREGLRTRYVTNNAVAIAWPPVLEPSGGVCTLYRDGREIAQTEAGGYIDTNVLPGTTYRYTLERPDGGASDVLEVTTGVSGYVLTREDAYADGLRMTDGDAREYAYAQVEGSACITLETGRKAYFAADVLTQADSHVSLVVSYFDNGYEPVHVDYNSVEGLTADSDYRTARFFRTNTNTWKTVCLPLWDAAFAGKQFYGSDFRINNQSNAPVHIRRVEAVRGRYTPLAAVEWNRPEDTLFASVYHTDDTASEAYFTCVEVAGRAAARLGTNDYGLAQKLYVRIDDGCCYAGQSRGTLYVTYLDNVTDGGGNQISVDYCARTEDGLSPYQKAGIKRTGTGQWKTAAIPMEDAWFVNAQYFGADVRINAVDAGEAPVYIARIVYVPGR